MKARLATLVEREGADGRYISGTLGEAVVILEQDGKTRSGLPRWRLMLATPCKPHRDKQRQTANRRGAATRIEQRKAEGIEQLGGDGWTVS